MKLRPLLILIALASSLATASISYAQVPPGSTGQCKDATYTSAASKQGACHGHGGVKEWYGQGNTTETTPAKSTTPTTSTKSTTSTTSTSPGTSTAPAGQAPAGSTGQCKDATYTSAASKQGACRGHGGVKEWYGQGNTTETTPAKSTTPTTSTKSTTSTTSTSPGMSTVPAGQAPAGSTGQCKDATYTSAASKQGACGGHGGVKEWYGKGNTTEAPSKATTPAVPTTTAPTTTAPTTTAPTTAPAKPTGTQATPGGGPGKVWVNTASHVYHCANDQWYGKTKQGEYMSEADAIAKGNHASHGKPCS
jgi:hypothetical protein